MDPSLSPTERADQQTPLLHRTADPAAPSSSSAVASTAASTAAQPATPSLPAYPCHARVTSDLSLADQTAPVAHADTTETGGRPDRTGVVVTIPVIGGIPQRREGDADKDERAEKEDEERDGEEGTDGGALTTPNACQALSCCNTQATAQQWSWNHGDHTSLVVYAALSSWSAAHVFRTVSLLDLPNEVLLHILGFLDVNDLLSTSRASRHFRCLCRAPILHILRRRRIRAVLAPLVAPARRPSLAELMARSIFLTHTTVVSRKLSRSLASIHLARRLAARPPAQVLVERCVLPPECAPGIGHVAPALAARARAVERARVKDGLRRWVGAVWQREVGRRSETIRRRDERAGIGKVWRLRRFWERISRGEAA